MRKQHANLFPKVDKATWMSKIKSDLKGRSVDDFLSFYGEDIKLSPFVHSDDVSLQGVNELRFEREGHTIPIAVIQEDNAEKANKLALHALDSGAGALLFLVGNSPDIRIITRGIEQAIAPVYFNIKNGNSIFLELGNMEKENAKNNAAKILSSIVTESAGQVVVQYSCSDNFYMNIASLRSIRIVIDQMSADLGRNIDLRLIAAYSSEKSDDIGISLEKSMPIVLAAFLGGANHITCLNASSANDHRLHFNLVHLLTMESGLPLNEDIITGSYYLETLTNQLSDIIWDKFLSITMTI